ncbi:UTP--glucose-1-phosphate uridylyltransferase GalU [Streptomyces sp. NRRL S-646]|uniref:UTP--glucose-1-phosphate uridylyltransferase GalU n=1 Tax=Streptomyces sp. NRRL S-646 TaxID=1463917 RepID=UPI000D13EC60
MSRMIVPHATSPRAVTKAVIPAAGLGTRFLPATKATPKEMLPVVDKPAIQYVVEEAAAAGLDDVLMVTGRHKRAIEDHFDNAFELEQALAAKGDAIRLDAVRDPARLANIHHIRQGEPLGLGHAVLCARRHVGDRPFAVLLGDDLIDPRETLLSRMLDVRDRHTGSVIALMKVPPEQIHLYGCAAVEATGEDGVVRVTGLVEKPSRQDAPSSYAVIGRYVLDPAVFDTLERTPPGRGGEIQLTDALQELAAGGTVHGVVFDGLRYDTGDKGDYLRTVVRLACDRDDLGPEFTAWLKEFVAGMEEGNDTGRRRLVA